MKFRKSLTRTQQSQGRTLTRQLHRGSSLSRGVEIPRGIDLLVERMRRRPGAVAPGRGLISCFPEGGNGRMGGRRPHVACGRPESASLMLGVDVLIAPATAVHQGLWLSLPLVPCALPSDRHRYPPARDVLDPDRRSPVWPSGRRGSGCRCYPRMHFDASARDHPRSMSLNLGPDARVAPETRGPRPHTRLHWRRGPNASRSFCRWSSGGRTIIRPLRRLDRIVRSVRASGRAMSFPLSG